MNKKSQLKANLFSLEGKKIGEVSLPKEIFASFSQPLLVAQAVRVFLANQRQAGAKVKRRGEVRGSGKKIWRQKGTGRARHGDRYAPIFVGGGVAHGPSGQENWHLKMPKKMKRKAFFTVLSDRSRKKKIAVIADLEKIDPKTKSAAALLSKLSRFLPGIKKPLVVTDEKGENIKRAFRNLPGVKIVRFDNLHTFAVLATDAVVFQQKALAAFIKFWESKAASLSGQK